MPYPFGVPAGTPREPGQAAAAAGGALAWSVGDPTCHIQGVGGIEAETARRLSCEADLIGAVVNSDGEVLNLGRKRRLVSRAQRRALMTRDGMCQFPACHQVRHLEAHHIVPWSLGGPTDLDNLILLCRWHHTAVHEGGMRIVSATEPSAGHRWDFLMPDGRVFEEWHSAEGLAYLLAQQPRVQGLDHAALIDSVDGFEHPDALRIRPGWRGERFDLHECVRALFTMRLPADEDAGEAA